MTTDDDQPWEMPAHRRVPARYRLVRSINSTNGGEEKGVRGDGGREGGGDGGVVCIPTV